VLFLDEPTSGVDPNSRRSFWKLIYEMADKGVTTFVTTHYMEEAEYCDRLGLIYRGELIALGTPNELKERCMPEQVLQVSCSAPQEALDVIFRLPGVRDVALFGNELHVVTPDAKALQPILRDSLEAKGVKVSTMDRIEPSMEDVFVSLIEARDRSEGAQKEYHQ